MKLLQDAAGDRGGRRTLRPLFGDYRFSGPAGTASCHPCHRGTPRVRQHRGWRASGSESERPTDPGHDALLGVPFIYYAIAKIV